MPGKVYRTAIYCRLSREDGDKVESNSIASQRAICEDYIARHDDLEIVCEPFVDDGYSGVSFNRPNFKKLEDAIRKGAIDCIVVKDLSRFSRNYIDGGRYLEKIFPQLGIRFIAVNDAYDSLTGDPQSDSFVIPFKNLINDSYCKDISMKIRSSLEVKQKNGEFVGAFAPYGYKKSPDNKNQLIVDGAVSEYVQMIFAMYKDGFSIGRIAARLDQMGVLSPMEYKMLYLFCKNPKQILTRQRLLERLWDTDENYVDEHTLTTSISRIRGKIEADGDTYIKTIYGIGYQWMGGERK